jgi:leucyl/phenylalanyl-tRNA--protein transferase
MAIIEFPDPRTASPEGIVAIGGDLHPDSVLAAYRRGIFPWPVDNLPLLWFCPPERAILRFSNLHVPRSLARSARRSRLRLSIDEAFAEVIRSCAETPRPGQDGTWITHEVIDAYIRLSEIGIAHSVEAWQGDCLVGGLYGVAIDGAFSAESMFYRVSNASKLCILYLVDHLSRRGLDWIDVQTMTPHMERLGAELLNRDEFLAQLETARARDLVLFD